MYDAIPVDVNSSTWIRVRVRARIMGPRQAHNQVSAGARVRIRLGLASALGLDAWNRPEDTLHEVLQPHPGPLMVPCRVGLGV